MKKFFKILVLLVLASQSLLAQDGFSVAMERQLWHDNIDKQQQRALSNVPPVEYDTVRFYLIETIDSLQKDIEINNSNSSQAKVKELRTVDFFLQEFNNRKGQADYPPRMAKEATLNFIEALKYERQGQSIVSVVDKSSYGVAVILYESMKHYMADNLGVQSAPVIILRKYCALYPDQILPSLRKMPNVTFADSLIEVAAKRDLRKLYDYAQVRDQLGNRIRNHTNPTVKAVAQMAGSKSGQMYFPFLDNIVKGRTSIEEIDAVKDNNRAYYKLMVNTRIDYMGRMFPPYRDTAEEMKALTDMMGRKVKETFVREINALHNVSNPAVRYKVLEGLSAPELYYIAVLSEDEIYTSSYVEGVYPRIFQSMKNPRGDSLLMSVHGDYFRKFIKMAAGYNTLDKFLATMDKENAETLMKSFVIGLERDNYNHDLEDAVDVADSYSSIMDKNKSLAAFVLNEVSVNHLKNIQQQNKRGIAIYRLLETLFKSAEENSKIDLSKELGIPSVYTQDYNELTDKDGKVIQQVFFYGDDDNDGQYSYANFLGMFRNKAGWKITDNNPNWVTITNTTGKPVQIFANKPLYGPDDPDDKAQDALIKYLDENNLQPTVVIHRGHSYHLPSTLRKLAPTAKIVVLGSCGGYNNLNEVLTICNDAHIISSKQVGTKLVNEPIIEALNNRFVAGKAVNWPAMWKELAAKIKDGDAKEKFEDYIPPYKNLGAIFIKAYRTAMNEE
jgi:hypothetical protein